MSEDQASELSASAALAQVERCANLGTWHWDVQSNQLNWSRQFFKICGWDAETFQPDIHAYYQQVHPDDRPWVMSEIDEILAGTREPAPRDYRFMRPDGELRYLRVSFEISRDDSDNVVSLSGVVVDVSEQQQLLEQLRHSQKMDALGKLAGGVAHDLNNYLQIISGNLELLEMQLPNHPKLSRPRAHIRSSVGLCASLTRSLLSFSRRQEGKASAQDAQTLLQEAVALAAPLLGAGIDVQVQYEAPGATVFCDPQEFSLIVFNLMVNARDAMAKGGVLRLRSWMGQSGFLTLSFQDSGVGMDASTKARVFEPFFTTKPNGHGTGLGLSTVYGIVNRMGGSIEVDSTLGKGSNFLVTLPLAKKERERPSSPVLRNPELQGAGRRVLIAEDEGMVRAFVESLLQEYGFETHAVENGELALSELKREPGYALLITDLVMPKMSGGDLLREAARVLPALPTLAMTGFAESEELEFADQSSDRILLKPFTGEQLIKSVARALLV